MGQICSGNNSLDAIGVGSEEDEKRDRDIQLAQEKKKEEDENLKKVLFLGSGESGKTTCLKQIRRIFTDRQCSHLELSEYVRTIRNNVALNMRNMIWDTETDVRRYVLSDKGAESKCFIMDLHQQSNFSLPSFAQETANHIETLWADPAIQQLWKDRSRFQVEDTCEYFFREIQRIMSPSYTPNVQDILRIRIRTTGIYQMKFEYKGGNFLMIDVGGQRSERRKWLHYFTGVTSVVFLAAVNEYDMKLYEDNSVNRLREALDLFENVINCPWFRDKPIILFLNKIDLIKLKLPEVRFADHFKDYTGDNESYPEIMKFMRDMFIDLDKCEFPRQIYVHETCSLDKENIDRVFHSVLDIVLSDCLHNVSLV